MKYMKILSSRLTPAIICVAALLLVSVPVAGSPVVTKTAVRFVEKKHAVDEVLSGPAAPCVARVPAWELSIVDGTYSRFAAKKAAVDCRVEFTEAVRDFTDEEKSMLTMYVVLIDSLIDADFPTLNTFPWIFAVISDSSDFGVPNSKTHIVLTKRLLREMTEWLDKQSSMMFVGMEILIHEKVRLLQGILPLPFEIFYKEVWGFRKISPLSADRLMQDNGLFFPIIPTNEWAIKVVPKGKEYIMPALLLRDAGAGEGGAVQRVAIAIDSTSKGFFPRRNKNMIVDYKDLRLIPQYRKKFPQPEHDYHPAELSADLLAKYLVMKYVSGRYGTAPTKASNYSQIDDLIRFVVKTKR